DSDATSVVVHVASGIEPAGEDVTLTHAGVDETWRGSISTAFGTPTPDGVLQVREGDAITATYTDLSPSHVSTATAKILASGPTIHDVTVTSISATSATVGWNTDEPSTTEVRYGTSRSSLPFAANATDLRNVHTIALTKLSPDALYYFTVTSRGRLANATMDANGGLGYRFQTAPLGDILLVVGGSSFPPEREASYAAALDGTGWTWSVWRVAELGLPPLGVLQGRRAVIWQVGLEQYPPFNATARTLVKSYLDGGGRLVVSSHDAAWALSGTTSPFMTADSAAWIHGVLKATFVCDPMAIAQVTGVTSDPISGPFAGGVPYTPHRSGGADDELNVNSVGGTTNAMWTDAQVTGCTLPNQGIGLHWVASSPNGTSAVGVWGGTRSRLAYFAFEITSIDTTATNLNPTSAVRWDILNRTLRWLVSTSTVALDRAPPIVRITAPNGGTFAGPTIPVTWIAAASGTGISIANFTLASSPDGGHTWNAIANLSGSTGAYIWNITSLANANRYVLRITAWDTGAPSLSSTDVTRGTFSIARTGGDTAGPLLWAGSLRIAPRPPGAAALARIIATADDRGRGGSNIAGAELFFRPTQPAQAENGTGIAVGGADGVFDEPVENLSWQGPIDAPPGVACAWIHAKDAAGNWGAYGSLCFVVIFVGPDTVPPTSAALASIRLTNGNVDLGIDWLAPWDQGLFGGTSAYHVFRATSPRGTYVDVSGAILANGSARYSFLDAGRGANASDAFYRIETVDAAGNTALSTSLAVKTHLSFDAGRNLLGMPVALTDRVLGDFAAGRSWADAWTYDACASGFRWSSAIPADPTTFAVPAGRGLWLNGTAADTIAVLGLVAEVVPLRLCAGWKLLALPGFPGSVTVRDLKAATGAIRVMGFAAAGPYDLQDLSDTSPLVVGVGYWAQVPADVVWMAQGW
ncbi:MAG: fibronectin type III domain-containing protein, partial [Thermoplasmata archaeon]|nr:fibronectin type III domain-containing protein [Thermoplasmata archaeon]